MIRTPDYQNPPSPSPAVPPEPPEDDQAVRSDFDRNYARFAPRVRGYLRRLIGDPAEAEDVTQDVFLAAYKGRHTYRSATSGDASGTRSPLSWLMGIARRRWRDQRRGAPLERTELPLDLSSGEQVEDQVVRSLHLQRCLDQLEPTQRTALLLVFGQGLTYAEAAAELEEPIGTVKWRVHAASRRMREMLREEPASSDFSDKSGNHHEST